MEKAQFLFLSLGTELPNKECLKTFEERYNKMLKNRKNQKKTEYVCVLFSLKIISYNTYVVYVENGGRSLNAGCVSKKQHVKTTFIHTQYSVVLSHLLIT